MEGRLREIRETNETTEQQERGKGKGEGEGGGVQLRKQVLLMKDEP